jgi:hypothetical protein
MKEITLKLDEDVFRELEDMRQDESYDHFATKVFSLYKIIWNEQNEGSIVEILNFNKGYKKTLDLLKLSYNIENNIENPKSKKKYKLTVLKNDEIISEKFSNFIFLLKLYGKWTIKDSSYSPKYYYE